MVQYLPFDSFANTSAAGQMTVCHHLSRCHCPQNGPRLLLPTRTPTTIRHVAEVHFVHGEYCPATEGDSEHLISTMADASVSVVLCHYRLELPEVEEEEEVVVVVAVAVCACAAYFNCFQLLEVVRDFVNEMSIHRRGNSVAIEGPC